MSIEYFASPVALAFPSTRGTRLPRIEYFREGSQGTGSPGATTISLTWKSPPKPTRILSVMSALLFHDVEDRLGDAGVVVKPGVGMREAGGEETGTRFRLRRFRRSPAARSTASKTWL